MDVYKKYARLLEKQLRLRTFPLAVKMLESEKDVPKGAKRPARNFGYQLNACQGFALSRREGMHLAMLKEDMWCEDAVIGYGFAKPSSTFMAGYTRFPKYVKTLEAGANYARRLPKFKVGKYIGIASAPLKTANFEPDVVLIYCNTNQLRCLLFDIAYRDGGDITCRISNECACVFSVVPPIQNKKCWITNPCGGDSMGALNYDELIFSAPKEELEDLIAGLKHVSKTWVKMPVAWSMRYEPEHSPVGLRVAKEMGMKRTDGSEL